MRWLYHVREHTEEVADGYVGPAFSTEGFTHCSYADEIHRSATLYFDGRTRLEFLQIDPRRLGVGVEIADTPRGPMPHVVGPIPRDAVRARIDPSTAVLDDEVFGTTFCFLAFDGMTLLDLVGVHDPVRRIATMGFDPTSTRKIVGPTKTVWTEDGATLTVDEVLPSLDDIDILILPGGPSTRTLEKDAAVVSWIRSFPPNRILATVCTGALLAAAAGRLEGVRATTHHSALDDLANYGAIVVDERVVDSSPIITAGGVTSGIDLGLFLVERLVGKAARDTIAQRMAFTSASVRRRA